MEHQEMTVCLLLQICKVKYLRLSIHNFKSLDCQQYSIAEIMKKQAGPFFYDYIKLSMPEQERKFWQVFFNVGYK